eukprot:315359-Rhodomonas_salina.1
MKLDNTVEEHHDTRVPGYPGTRVPGLLTMALHVYPGYPYQAGQEDVKFARHVATSWGFIPILEIGTLPGYPEYGE